MAKLKHKKDDDNIAVDVREEVAAVAAAAAAAAAAVVGIVGIIVGAVIAVVVGIIGVAASCNTEIKIYERQLEKILDEQISSL